MNPSKCFNNTVSNWFPQLPCRFVLKGFSEDGRDLTDAETKEFMKAADKDGDGKIGIDGEKKRERWLAQNRNHGNIVVKDEVTTMNSADFFFFCKRKEKQIVTR